MICILLVCALVSGSARECDREKTPDIVPLPREIAATWTECRDAARELRAVTPANLRIVRFEWYRPQTQEAKR